MKNKNSSINLQKILKQEMIPAYLKLNPNKTEFELTDAEKRKITTIDQNLDLVEMILNKEWNYYGDIENGIHEYSIEKVNKVEVLSIERRSNVEYGAGAGFEIITKINNNREIKLIADDLQYNNSTVYFSKNELLSDMEIMKKEKEEKEESLKKELLKVQKEKTKINDTLERLFIGLDKSKNR